MSKQQFDQLPVLLEVGVKQRLDGRIECEISTGHVDGHVLVEAMAAAIATVLTAPDNISKAAGHSGSLRNTVVRRAGEIVDTGKTTRGTIAVRARDKN